jgi:hypothetical protein
MDKKKGDCLFIYTIGRKGDKLDQAPFGLDYFS